jgi:hypothetical protein
MINYYVYNLHETKLQYTGLVLVLVFAVPLPVLVVLVVLLPVLVIVLVKIVVVARGGANIQSLAHYSYISQGEPNINSQEINATA